jgi:hypothetical protein
MANIGDIPILGGNSVAATTRKGKTGVTLGSWVRSLDEKGETPATIHSRMVGPKTVEERAVVQREQFVTWEEARAEIQAMVREELFLAFGLAGFKLEYPLPEPTGGEDTPSEGGLPPQ